jgi:hypothetical protein
MKKLFVFLVVMFSVTMLCGQNSAPVFDPSKLSESEVKSLEEFRKKKDQPRFEEFQKIKHLFPSSEYTLDSAGTSKTYLKETVTIIMTRPQLEELIGQPDFQNGGYVLGDNRCDCSVNFTTNSKDEIIGFSFSSCKKYFNI